ncbi:MAG TPA: CPBP family intramembrane metalloprotease [Chlamydiae bacterium]|nr:hypothetical protein [Candidatus Anoxychlamydiales bacterium]HEU64675.1 CPBP family intramembrane metalloprotease [Chlamydiota bacterium]
MTTKIANISVPTSFVKNPSIASPITASFTNNKNVSKIQKTALVNLLYVKDAIKVFFLDLYNSFFSWRIITKIPFFIFFYGFWTAFGAVDTIYYVALTIFVLKASKDLISSLSDRNILRKFSEYFPIKNRLDALKSILKGASFGPFLFALDRFLTKFIVKSFQFFKLKVFDENKLIYQGGFLGGFSTFYAILIYPVIKEVLFRGYIESYFSENTKSKNTSKSFLKTAIKTAVIFGIYHFSPTGGFLNIPIIIVNIALGLIYSSLNHKKNNLWASASCSIVNAFFLTANLKYLKFS